MRVPSSRGSDLFKVTQLGPGDSESVSRAHSPGSNPGDGVTMKRIHGSRARSSLGVAGLHCSSPLSLSVLAVPTRPAQSFSSQPPRLLSSLSHPISPHVSLSPRFPSHALPAILPFSWTHGAMSLLPLVFWRLTSPKHPLSVHLLGRSLPPPFMS